MAYVALYRRWRPQDFDTLVGQQPVKTALTNALTSGRIAHAYLFAGPRGTGKTSTARILAKALNCEQGPTTHPCGKCASCQRITEGASMDVLEIDAASNRGIDEIKALRDQLAFAPVDGRYKVYIIDEVHMLTTEAFNALLKTLEEPPAHVIFILATTDPHKIPPTIHSRCQRFDFRRVTVDEIAEHLAMVAASSDIEADEDALRLIAIQSEGGMRDALSLLDQCGVMSKKVTAATVREVLGIVGRETLRELVCSIGKQDLPLSLEKVNLLLEQGKDPSQILIELAEYLRALLLFKAAPTYNEVYLTDTKEALEEAAPLYGQERLMAAEERIHLALQELRSPLRSRITIELCLFDLCRMEGSTIAALAARVEELERQVARGPVLQAAPVYAPAPQAVRPVQAAQPVYENTAAPVAPPVQPVQAAPAPAPAAPVAKPQKPQAAKTVQPAQPVYENTATPASSASAAAPAQKPAAKPAQAANVATAAVDEYVGDWATGEDYWNQALDMLKAERKNSIVSCARTGGRVVGFENNLLRVAYKAKFICDRMAKDDYRKVVEDALLRITRQAIRLECVVAGAKPKATTAKAKPAAPVAAPVASAPVANHQAAPVASAPAAPTAPVATAPMPSAPIPAEAPKAPVVGKPVDEAELPEILKKAHDMLGGTINKV